MLNSLCCQESKSECGNAGPVAVLNTCFSCPVACLLLGSEYRRGTLRSDESAYPAVAMYPTPESPPLCESLGCQSLRSKEAQTVQAQGSAERCFLCSCLRADTTCLLGFHRTAGLTTQDVVTEPRTQIFLTFVFLLLNGQFGRMVLEIDPF